MSLLEALLKANLALAAAVAVVWVLRGPVRRAFGAGAAYGLWVAPLLAAGAALAPHPTGGLTVAPFVARAGLVAATAAEPVLRTPAAGAWLLALWLAGMAAMAGGLAVQQARFRREVAAGRAGPAVIGVLRPRIVTPADFEARFAAEEQAVILRHEAVHLARGDALANALAAAVQCLCWFNPAAHVAGRLMRVDQELACDAAVLAQAPAARRLYAEVLLKTQLAGQAPPLGCFWPPASEHPLKARIAMLKSPLPRRARRIAGLAAVTALTAAGAAAAWVAPGTLGSPDPDVAADAAATITSPIWLEKPTGADIARLYPAEAARRGVGGQATISCRIKADGRIASCAVARAVADGDDNADGLARDFGTATLQAALLFRMAPKDAQGHSTSGGIVRIPVRWTPPRGR